jgi:hypothetical protein
VSDPAATGEASVAVDRLDAVCLVAPDQPAESVRWQIDRIARTRLERSLARAMQHLVAADDSSVWLIRALEAEVALGVDGAIEDELAREWAEGIVRAFAETLAHGPDGDRVIRFPSRAAFLARFAADVVAGRAWHSWWYDSLEPLRALPAGTAVREAFVGSTNDGAQAIALLVSERSFENVLVALSERDAGVLLASLFPERGAPRGPIAAELAASVLAAVADLPANEEPATAKNALRIVATGGAQSSGPSALRWVTERVLGVVGLARAVGAEECIRALRAADAAALVSSGRVSPHLRALLPELVELAAAEPSLVARAASVVEPSARATHSGSAFVTDFGGVFLLLPAALELDLPRLLGDDASLRLQLLARCVGARDSAAAADSGLLLAAGADRSWLDPAADVDPALPRLLLERLVRLGRVEGRCLAAELTPTPHGDALVLRDIATDALAYVELTDVSGDAFERGLRIVREATELRCECVLFGLGLEHCADAVEAECVATYDNFDAVPSGLAPELQRWLAHARQPTDLECLSLPGTPPAPDLAWSLVAHAVVRGLSGRLPGFAMTSVAYLRQSFLRTGAAVRIGQEAVEVELARVPLQVVLQLAGFDRRTATIPWIGTELTIRLGED